MRASLATTVAIGASLLGTLISYVSTGSNPHFASCAANDAQDVYPVITDRFKNYAYCLSDLHESNDLEDKRLATRLATAFLERHLHQTFQRLHLNKSKIGLAMEPLETVSRAVLGETRVSYQPSSASREILRKRIPIAITPEGSRNHPSPSRDYPFMSGDNSRNTTLVSVV